MWGTGYGVFSRRSMPASFGMNRSGVSGPRVGRGAGSERQEVWRALSDRSVLTQVDSPRFGRYSAYRDSGVEWLGQIPAHWETMRADQFLRCEKIQLEPSAYSGELVFHYSIPSIQETGDGVVELGENLGSAKLKIAGRRLLVSRVPVPVSWTR